MEKNIHGNNISIFSIRKRIHSFSLSENKYIFTRWKHFGYFAATQLDYCIKQVLYTISHKKSFSE